MNDIMFWIAVIGLSVMVWGFVVLFLQACATLNSILAVLTEILAWILKERG